MFDLFLCCVCFVDDILIDIVIQDGKIVVLGEISVFFCKIIELNGKVYVSVGWIDFYVYCYLNLLIYYDELDSVGIVIGVIIVIDVGSIGVDDVDDFY